MLKVSERIHRRLIITHLKLLSFLNPKRPIQLRYWLALRSTVSTVFHFPDTLATPYDTLEDTGASLRSPELQQLLGNDLLGTWALDVPTIDFLWERMERDLPKNIIECGAGISSLILARHATSHFSGSDVPPLILSLEQSLQVKEETESRLARHGLSKQVRILHAPLSAEGRYLPDLNELDEHLKEERIDWLFIDGPAGPDGCRVWTLPLLSRLCRPGARWFLDDAFRDGELQALREWSQMPGVIVEGIYPIGKGLATGVVKDPRGVNLE